MNAARGAALLLVLWLVALLAALIGAFALTARIESLQGRVLREGAAAQQIARAGVEYALLRVQDRQPQTRWVADGRRYDWRFAGSDVQVRIVDESGKVDLNQADAQLLSLLMQAVGEPREAAERMAAAIIDWRDPDSLGQPVGSAEDADYAAAGLPYGAKDAPFDTVAELGQVLGMTPALYARLSPWLTLHSGRAMPDPAFAPAPVLTAMGLDAQAWLAQREGPLAADGAQFVGAGSGTYSIESRARLPNGRQAALRTVVRTGGGPVPGSVYTILRWEEGEPPQ
ncbi:general secretion pathway protein GspK [Pseudoxanthomonas mexicana]|uniref:general secretion pathway protein GspK n=1 Tax=Pseudoxanthomonas mexicana TaxID=128785 RepID=UPI00398A5302